MDIITRAVRLSKTAHKILNDPIRIKQRDLWFSRLQGVFDGKHVDSPPVVKGICGRHNDDMLIYSNPEQWVVESLEDLAQNIDLCDDNTIFVPPCVQLDAYGVHFADSFFGAEPYFDSSSGQWYTKYITANIGMLKSPDLDSIDAWNIVKRATTAFLKQDVSLPLIGLPTIASALNIAVNLYGEEILAALMLEPNDASRDLSIINAALTAMHKWFLSALPTKQLQPVLPCERAQPPGYGQICGCTSQLVGAGLYEEHIAPLDNDLLCVYPNGGMIHLCGSHTHLIDAFKSMKNLKSIQVNDKAADDLELYHSNLRDDQILYLMPSKDMDVKRALEITKGRRLVVIDKFGQ